MTVMAVFTRDGNYVVFRGPERHCPDAPRPGGGVLKRGPALLVYVTPSSLVVALSNS